MRMVVCVKQTYDPQTIRISRSREELDLREAVRITNRPDRYALEVALWLRAMAGGEVIALTVGDAAAEDTSHEAVACGADRGLLIKGPDLAEVHGAVVVRIIAAAVAHLAPVGLVLTGQAGLVDGTGSLAARLAVALEWPVVLDAVRLTLADGRLEALVSSDEGHWAKKVPVATPAVAAIAPGLERPRYPHAAAIANAWQPGKVEVCTLADLGLTADALLPDVEFGGLVLGPERTRGQVLGGSPAEAARALVKMLHTRRVLG